MKFVSHIVIGGAITFAFAPPLVPIGILGGTAPDWMEIVADRLKRPVKHRTVTHYLAAWVLVICFSVFVWDFYNLIFWFGIGGLSHVIADSLTVQGVPLGWWSDRRFHLFGGRIRTGQSSELFVVAAVAIAGLTIGYLNQGYGGNFYPFFFDWPEYYESGLIDGYEWKQNRWRWF